VKRASERDYSLLTRLHPLCVSKECVTPAGKNYYQTLAGCCCCFSRGASNNCALQTHMYVCIYKKNTQDPAQGIILHAAGLSRLYTYHLWLVVPGLFLPASPQNIQKIFFRPDFVLYVSVRFHARDRDACLFFMLIVILYTHLLT
jgi:hypothetical protein